LIAQRIAHRATIEGRADDAAPEIVQNRIDTYHQKTEPIIGYYSAAGKYHEIDGTGTIEEVAGRISALMNKF